MYRDFDLETLEQEYSPSSCVDDIMIYINQYIRLSEQAKSAAKANNTLIENLSYGSSQDEVLDLFLPEKNSETKKQLQVYIHGGYWQELTKNESCFAATNFQNNGYHFAVINYSLAPAASLTEIVEQNRRALVWLYQNAEKYDYNKNEIYLSGSSAGAHLAMMMALTDWSEYLPIKHNIIKGVCAVSGIYDLTPIQQTYINKPLQLTSDEIEQLSPWLLLNKHHELIERLQQCAITFSYGDNETSEFKRQTDELVQRLKQLGVSVEFTEIAHSNHFDVITELSNENSNLFRKLLLI